MNWQIPPEQIREALGRAPRPIREFIVEGELVQIAQKVATEHHLHVDATGMLVQLMTAVLLGFLDPALLPSEVRRLGVETNSVSRFINDLNTQIFIPLQKRVKDAGHEPNREARIEEGVSASTGPVSVAERPASFRTTPPAPVATPPAVAAPIEESRPIPQPVVPANEAPAFNLVGSMSPASTPPPAPVTPASVPVAPVPTMRTMQHDIDALQHGQVPTPFPTHLEAMTPSIAQATPARAFQTASVPFTSAPQRPAPIQVPSSPLPPTPTPRPPQPQVPQAQFPGSASQGVSTDPYREPI